MRRIYFDHNASSPLRPEARAAMLGCMDAVGNPSSVHREGRAARAIVESAREDVALLIGAKPSEIIFTSGATEANVWAVSQGWDTIFFAGIEHESVLGPIGRSGARAVELAVETDGCVASEQIAERVLLGWEPTGRALVTLQLANNETGVLQDVAPVAQFCRAHGLATHTDAVQAAGRVAIDVNDLGIDLLSLSAHKLGGPKGIGALFVREGFELTPLLVGGGQERRSRAGTENVVAAAGFGAAARAARAGLRDQSRLAGLRNLLEECMRALVPEAQVIGAGASRLPNTISIGVAGLYAETLVIQLDLAGCAVSAGAACSSGKVARSHVLEAMGIAPEIADSVIRVSLGWTSSENDLEPFLTAWANAVVRSLQRKETVNGPPLRAAGDAVRMPATLET